AGFGPALRARQSSLDAGLAATLVGPVIVYGDPQALDAGEHREVADAAARDQRPHRRCAELPRSPHREHTPDALPNPKAHPHPAHVGKLDSAASYRTECLPGRLPPTLTAVPSGLSAARTRACASSVMMLRTKAIRHGRRVSPNGQAGWKRSTAPEAATGR